MSIMLNDGSRASKLFHINFSNKPITMEELVALRYALDPKYAPALAAELDAIIDEAQFIG